MVRVAQWLGCSYWELRNRPYGEYLDMLKLMQAEIKYQNWQQEQSSRHRK